METNRLRQFCHVAETLNLRKSAELLGITHSALSKSLKVFQDEVKKTLFIPVGRGLGLTDEGREFYQKAKLFLKHEEELLKKEVVHVNVLKVGTFEAFSTYTLCSDFDRYFKGMDLELHEFLPGKIEQAIASGFIDYGITYQPIALDGIEYIKVAKIKLSVFKRRGAFNKIPFAELPFAAPIHPSEGSPTEVKGLDGWPDREHPRKIRFKVDMLESALTLARQGLAAVFLPEFLVALHNENAPATQQLHRLDSPNTIKATFRDVYLMHRKGGVEGSELKNLAKLIRAATQVV